MKNYSTPVWLMLLIALLAGCAGKHIRSKIPPPTTPPIAEPSQTPQEENTVVQVLFIGNSLTYYNNLPLLFAKLAKSAGHKVVCEMSAKGGWTLGMHMQDQGTLSRIDEQMWDYVILQEHSLIPAMVAERDKLMYPAARYLNEIIIRKGAQTIFFMTWGYRNGLDVNGLDSFDEMQDVISEGYIEIAEELYSLIVPIGVAWKNAVLHRSQLELWRNDGVHPNVQGSYLSACVLYAVIYQENPVGLSYKAGLSRDTAHFLQKIAAETVLDDSAP